LDFHVLRSHITKMLFVGASLTVVAVCPIPSSVAGQTAHHNARHEAKPSVFRAFFDEMIRKVRELAAADQVNQELRARVAELELMNQRLAYETLKNRESARVEENRKKNEAEGGRAASRTIASLEPSDAHILSKPPKEIFSAGVQAFGKGDHETAASAFLALAENKENTAYHRPQVFFLAGVSLFKMKNYKTAKTYFEKAAQSAEALGEQSDELAYAPRALAWLALAHNELGESDAKKNVLKNLIQNYPKSQEARRVNAGH